MKKRTKRRMSSVGRCSFHLLSILFTLGIFTACQDAVVETGVQLPVGFNGEVVTETQMTGKWNVDLDGVKEINAGRMGIVLSRREASYFTCDVVDFENDTLYNVKTPIDSWKIEYGDDEKEEGYKGTVLKMVSKGKMYCQQPSKLRWEYTSPYTYTFILNDNNVMLKSGSRSDVIDINQNKMFKEIARIMMNSVLGKLLTDKKDFAVTVKPSGKQYVATLTPLRKDLKQMFTQIVLHYDTKEGMVKSVVLNEKNGDSTTIELTNIKKNSTINASVFEIK